MKNTLVSAKSWVPDLPSGNDAQITLNNNELQTFIEDGRPGIIVVDQELVDPACFWIDRNHVYLRVNWSTWSTVSLSSPDHVASLCKAYMAKITHCINNVVNGHIIPVYHIAELPEELFHNSDDTENELVQFDTYDECFQKVSRIVESASKTLSTFRLVQLDDDVASAVISSDNYAIIIDFLSEDRYCVFTPAAGQEVHQAMFYWPSMEIPLDFVDKLKRMKKALEKMEPEARIEIGFLANPETIEELECMLHSQDLCNIRLFSYETLKKQLISLYKLK